MLSPIPLPKPRWLPSVAPPPSGCLFPTRRGSSLHAVPVLHETHGSPPSVAPRRGAWVQRHRLLSFLSQLGNQ